MLNSQCADGRHVGGLAQGSGKPARLPSVMERGFGQGHDAIQAVAGIVWGVKEVVAVFQ